MPRQDRPSRPRFGSIRSTPEEDPDLVLVGRVGRPHGLRGGVVVEPVTDSPEMRFSVGSVLLTSEDIRLTVDRYEATDRAPIITFEGIVDRATAESLRGVELFIAPEERRALDPDEFWPDELVGMSAVNPSGDPIGMIADVETGAGQDRLVVETSDGPLIVPFVAEIVPDVDRQARRVVVVLPEGLTP